MCVIMIIIIISLCAFILQDFKKHGHDIYNNEENILI
jgi:hypothetical protein